MSDIITKLKNSIPDLAPGEKKIALLCLKNTQDIIKNSIHQHAKQAQVSVATVSRLANKLGYKNWKEFKIKLAIETNNKKNEDNLVYQEIQKNDSNDIVIKKVVEANIDGLKQTIKTIQTKEFMEIIQQIKITKKIIFFGSGGSGYIAKDEALRFSHLELAAEAYTEDYQMLLNAAKMTKNDIAIAISNSGRSKGVIQAIKEAKKNKAITIAITNYEKSPLAKNADKVMVTKFSRCGEITASLTARIATMGIMDVIYTLAAHHGMIAEKVKEINKTLEINLRVQNKKQEKIV